MPISPSTSRVEVEKKVKRTDRSCGFRNKWSSSELEPHYWVKKFIVVLYTIRFVYVFDSPNHIKNSGAVFIFCKVETIAGERTTGLVYGRNNGRQSESEKSQRDLVHFDISFNSLCKLMVHKRMNHWIGFIFKRAMKWNWNVNEWMEDFHGFHTRHEWEMKRKKGRGKKYKI